MQKNTRQNQPASALNREQIEGSFPQRYDIRRHAKTARAVAEDHAKRALIWIWDWTITDVATIAVLLQVSHSSAARVIARLLRQGFIAKLPLTGVPTLVYHMTSVGVQVTQGFIQNASPEPPASASRIWINNAQHDLICARVVAHLVHSWRDIPSIWNLCVERSRGLLYSSKEVSEICLTYVPSRLCRDEELLQKKYDALINLDSIMIGVEIQQTYESETLRQVALSRIAFDMGSRYIAACIYASTNPRILKGYESGFVPTLKQWKRDERNRYVEDHSKPSPFMDWMKDRLVLIARPDLERAYYTSISLR